MVYQKFDGTVKSYLLDPYHLFAYHGNWYVVGFNQSGGRIATFAISRIREVVMTGRLFVVDDSFDVNTHINRAFGIVRGGKPFRVRLLFSPEVSAYIRERVWHPSQHMMHRGDGSVELCFETAGWNELVRWILSWQPDVKVLSPSRLRDRIREKMMQGMAV